MEQRMLNQVLRYATVASLCGGMNGGTLLEVGSGSRGIVGYVGPRWQITACDTSFDDYGASQLGDGRRVQRIRASVLDLPFSDKSFDVVVAVDLLEHIPGPDRTRALQELRRVTARRLVVGCPCGRAAEHSDRDLASFYSRHNWDEPGWLTEHLANGLPDSGSLIAAASPRDAVAVLPNSDARLHRLVLAGEAVPYLQFLLLGIGTLLGGLIRLGGPVGQITCSLVAAITTARPELAYRHVAVIDPAPPR